MDKVITENYSVIDVLNKSILFAVTKHANQVDKSGDSYILHPLRVMMDMTTFKTRIIAILHDVVEDTDATLEDIRVLLNSESEEFITDVVDAIDCISKRLCEDYDKYLDRVKTNPLALVVKISDVRDNMSPMRQYRLSESKQTYLKDKYSRALHKLHW